jgi:hypothetical protein
MRGDELIGTQLLMAQAFNALAATVSNSVGIGLTPVSFAILPDAGDAAGMLACINNSNTNVPGTVISGSGTYTVLAFCDGVNWKVVL